MQVTRFPARANGISARMAGFTEHLRMNGLTVGPSETHDALNAITHLEVIDPAEVRLALKTLLAQDKDIWDKFDQLFDAYWFNAGTKHRQEQHAHVRRQTAKPMLWKNHFGEEAEEGDQAADTTPGSGEGDAEGTDGKLVASLSENLNKRDLRELNDEESLRAAEEAAEKLARAIRDRRSRRRKQAKRGQELDFRRIQRAAIARGGDPVDLKYRARPDRPMKLVALVDVSGSMTVYARVFLAFIKGLISVDTSAEAFLFHTKLMRVTPALRDKDTLRAAGRLSLMAEGFGGGTDIGGSLTTICDQYGGTLNGRTVVLVLSDGYCTGKPEVLGNALARLRKKARRIVWLNPLLGWKDYAPVAAGIGAALPYLDAHLPANTIEALARLEPEFARI